MAIKLFSEDTVTIPVAGTRVPISVNATAVQSVVIKARDSNIGFVYVGDATVTATRAIELSPGESISLSADSLGRGSDEFILSDLWVDSESANNEINVAYVKRR
jgi:hypothetical protein